MRTLPRKAYEQALRRARAWLSRGDVVAIAIGLRRRAGRWRREPALVVTVRWKRSENRLKTLGIDPLPSSVRTRIGKRVYEVPVDIEGARGRMTGKRQGLVASQLESGRRQGMVGAVVVRGRKRFIMTAGHVVRTNRAAVTIHAHSGPIAGIAREVHVNERLDHALVEPSVPLPPGTNSLPRGEAIIGVRAVSSLRLDERMFFRKLDNKLRRAIVLKVRATLPFNEPDGSVTMVENLIATSHGTDAGDSGTLLYDHRFRAVGTLVGEFGEFSCFLPCQPSFAALNVILDIGDGS